VTVSNLKQVPSALVAGDPIVDVRDLAKVYRSWSLSGRRRVDALGGVSLQAAAGEVFGLLGPNGAGKTTLIKILLGVVKPTRGNASLFGQPVGSATARLRVGYLPESLSIDPHHTARSALRYYGRLSRMSGGLIDRRSDELLDLVGLGQRDKESVRRFSKGMRQRLGLAQALMHDPDLLVLDEPTDGLDPVGRSEVRKVIERLRDVGKTIFLNSHILQEVELICSRVAVLSHGKIRGAGRLEELAGDGHVNRVVIETHIDNSVDPDTDRSRVAECFDSLLDGELPSLATGGAESKGWNLEIDAAGTGKFRVGVDAPGQPAIDLIVDNLRRAGISICRLEVKRPTLEDTFIRLVGQSDDLAISHRAEDELVQSDREDPQR
jgi:ABC-2 type transport system ATP-binding protein